MALARPFVPTTFPGTPEEHRRKLAEGVNAILNGAVPWVQEVTLRASQATTPIVGSWLRESSAFLFCPLTASASASTVYVTNRITGSATLNHTSDAATDRRFAVVVIG